MTQRYIGVNRGADYNVDALAFNTSTNSTDIELRIDDTKGFTTVEIDAILDAFERFVFQKLPNKGV
jgi:hypothetical protein